MVVRSFSAGRMRLGRTIAEPLKERGLSGIGLGDTAQTELPISGGWQYDVMRLNARRAL
jgi:hypothetical protein